MSCLNFQLFALDKIVQVVYDPQSRFEELSMELKSSSSALVSNLTLFSPSKVCHRVCLSVLNVLSLLLNGVVYT